MNNKFQFTFDKLEAQYRQAIDFGYQFITCQEFAKEKANMRNLTVVNRVDIDLSVKKAEVLRLMFKKLGVRATFFVRLHASEYNPFSFENYRILKAIRDDGHEIGYHSEIVDQAVIWGEDAARCLERDLKLLSDMLEITISGVASHGGMTGLNNLDFWKDRSASEFGLAYEAYDDSAEFGLFKRSLYVSDSEWTQWKSYQMGELCEGDQRSFGSHAQNLHPLIYLLIHPETYYHTHTYEGD